MERYCVVPVEVLAIPTGPFKVWCCLALHWNNRDRVVWVRQTTIAKLLDLHKDTVRMHIRSLVQEGWVVKFKEDRRVLYRLPHLEELFDRGEETPAIPGENTRYSGKTPAIEHTGGVLEQPQIDPDLPLSPDLGDLSKGSDLEDLEGSGEKSEKAQQPDLMQLEPVDPPEHQAVQEAFQVWQEVTGRERARLDDKRRRWLTTGIENYGLRDALLMIRGVGRSDFHMGDNDRGKAYNEPFHIFRDAEHAEHFLQLAVDAGPVGSYAEKTDFWMQAYLDFIAESDHTKATDKAKPLSWLSDIQPKKNKRIRGILVPDFGKWQAELNLHATNLAAAIWACRQALEEYPDDQEVVELCQQQRRGTRAAFLQCYQRRIDDERRQADEYP